MRDEKAKRTANALVMTILITVTIGAGPQIWAQINGEPVDTGQFVGELQGVETETTSSWLGSDTTDYVAVWNASRDEHAEFWAPLKWERYARNHVGQRARVNWTDYGVGGVGVDRIENLSEASS